MELTVQSLTLHVRHRTTQERPISVSLIQNKSIQKEHQNYIIWEIRNTKMISHSCLVMCFDVKRLIIYDTDILLLSKFAFSSFVFRSNML